MSEDKLPGDWVWTTLGEVAGSISSGFPTGKHNNEGMGVPHLRPMNINVGGEIDLTVIRYVEDTEYQPLQQGDILFNNTNSAELVGKTAVVLEDTNWLYSNHMTRIKVPSGLVESRYVSYFLQSLFLNGVFKENSKQHVNQASIGRDFLLNLKIPLPPLADQIRIANLLDRLMEQLRSTQAALAEVPGLLRQFRQKVLAMGMRGELTKGWRKENPNLDAKLLLLEIKNKFENGKFKRFKIKSDEEVIDKMEELPQSWLWVKVGHIGEVQLGRQRSPANRSRHFPTKYIRAANITESGLDLEDLLSMEFTPEEKERFRLKRGDILLSEASGSLEQVGKPAIWEDQVLDCCFQNTIIRVKPVIVSSEFVFFVFKGFYHNKVFARKAAGVGINHLGASNLANMNFPLPSLEEQKEIIRQIKYYFTLSDQLKADYEAAKSELDALPQSLLAKAFRGKLCPPEPGAESAEILLVRIREEKARLDILEKEQRSQRQARKMKSDKKADLKALAVVLETSKGEWILARMAWQQSEHRDDIEGFYAELKRLIESEQMVEEEKRGKESYLRMTQA